MIIECRFVDWKQMIINLNKIPKNYRTQKVSYKRETFPIQTGKDCLALIWK